MIAPAVHRPWPLPRQPWALAMQWHELLFMHWPVPVAAVRDWIPRALTVDTFDGSAWVGVVPFVMRAVRPRLTPALPNLSHFPELNLRTYVTAEGKPGVWFFSLDAAHPLAVRVARRVFHLPYFDARMKAQRVGDTTHYLSVRSHRGAPPAEFQGHYRPTGPVDYAQPGSIAHWLTERYCLYAANRRGHIWRGDVHHAPWPLQPAEAEVSLNTLPQQIQLTLPDTNPLLHYTRRLDVVAWMLQPVAIHR